jgi:hypothetical protein
MACWVSVNDATSCRSSSIHRLIGVTSFGDFKARLSIISTAFHPQEKPSATAITSAAVPGAFELST